MPSDVNDRTDWSREAARWTWITGTDPESRRRAKAHTSREVKRRKADLSQTARDRRASRRKPWLLASAKLRKDSEFAQLAKNALVPDPASPLGAGRVDPFAQHPVLFESNELHELMDHFLFTAPRLRAKPQQRVCFLPLFQEIRRVAFELAQDDPAAFHTILAIASADRSILGEEEEPIQAIAYNAYSITLLNKRLSNAEDATTDKTITTVALQIIFLLLFEDCDAVKAHADALECLVNLRGGLEFFEISNPQLALLINLADYLPPVAALLGTRRFHRSDESVSEAATRSPAALLAPNGLEALAHFDMYFDITRICLSLQQATSTAFSGDLWTSSVTESKLKSQPRDLVVLGTSKTAWGRRCEIMKCVCLAGLIYMHVISRENTDIRSAHERISQLLPEWDTSWKHSLELLIGELLLGPGDEFDSLTALMRIGTFLNQKSWYDIRRHLQDIYLEVHDGALQSNIKVENSQDMEMAGLTALFGFFNFTGS
ncbi:hypothetical protein N431DRAFT_347844 [Stipitochalara longipes BDJ]|nr:hypothetical protein N431DRAFT_347844 [Stipitochalara longipes BDJ]